MAPPPREPPAPLGLFEGYGVELEYMIVDQTTLDVRPIADRLIGALAGTETNEVELGELACSNELALHVFELKTNGPAATLAGLGQLFGQGVAEANRRLAEQGAQLMPTAMHPWMDPDRETKLWPHEQNEIYRAFDGIFDCRGHGWSNLQSAHLNLPFASDAEFGHLHAAIRVLLPLLPALAASSPVVGGRLTGQLDARLAYYRDNCRRVPSITGRVVPEAVFTRADYEREILRVIERDLAPLDQTHVLEAEWTNARGAIARFVRDAIEIRVLDVQECPEQDLAIIELVSAVLFALVERELSDVEVQRGASTGALASVFDLMTVHAEGTLVEEPELLRALGFRESRLRAGEIWRALAERCLSPQSTYRAGIEHVLRLGTLATRIRRRLSSAPTRGELEAVFSELCACLAAQRRFE